MPELPILTLTAKLGVGGATKGYGLEYDTVSGTFIIPAVKGLKPLAGVAKDTKLVGEFPAMVSAGIAQCVSGGVIAVGDLVVCDIDGRFVAINRLLGPQNLAFVHGIAQTSATAAGIQFDVHLMNLSAGNCRSYLADTGGTTIGHGVTLSGSTANTVIIPATKGALRPVGVALQTVLAAAAVWVYSGEFMTVLAGDTAAIGANVVPGTNGKWVLATIALDGTIGNNSHLWTGGTALETFVDGQLKRILFQPQLVLCKTSGF
jgi:hypothetical protein